MRDCRACSLAGMDRSLPECRYQVRSIDQPTGTSVHRQDHSNFYCHDEEVAAWQMLTNAEAGMHGAARPYHNTGNGCALALSLSRGR